MKTPLLYICFLSMLVFSSCKKDKVKLDSQDPRLPAYTEQGLRTSGILINDTIWSGTQLGVASQRSLVEIFSYPDADSVLLLFNGGYPNALEFLSPTRELFIVLRGLQIRTDEDLKTLNGRRFNLDGQIQYGGFSLLVGSTKAGRGAGFIQFGKVDRMPNLQYGDGSPGNPIRYAYIVSGRFEFSFTTTRLFELTNGRFDATVSQLHSFTVY